MYRRFALLGSVALVLVHAPRASAQVPLSVEPEAAPAPQPDPMPAAPAPAVPAVPAPAAPAPAAPAAAAPAAEARPGAPAAAKTDHLVQVAPETATPLDDEDEGDLREGPRRQWYGWQTLAADGGSLLLLIGSGAVQGPSKTAEQASSTLAAMGLLGYEFAPGIIHFAHGHTGKGFGSFGLRLGMPLAGIIVGASAASGCDSFQCEANGAAIGLLLGMAGAIVIDAAALAYEDTRASSSEDASIAPLLVVAPRAAFIGVGGRL